MPRRKKVVRRKKVPPGSIGLEANETLITAGAKVQEVAALVQKNGGSLLASYRDPFGGRDLILAALPVGVVKPTPYQRDVTESHVKRLMTAIENIGSFLDPIVVIPRSEGYWTPNGNHRLEAMKKLGAKSITALIVPDSAVAFKILALNTEKAHNLRERSLEVVRMYKALAEESSKSERDFAFEFDEPAYLTLGLCYEARPRFSGGAYQSVLRRVDEFLDLELSKALPERVRRAKSVLELDDCVADIVARLREQGLVSPYLKPFVVARIDPTRFSKAAEFDFDRVIGKMMDNAARFDVNKIRPEDLARSSGAPEAEE